MISPEVPRQAAGNRGDRLLHLPWEDRGPDRQRESAGLQKHKQVMESKEKQEDSYKAVSQAQAQR